MQDFARTADDAGGAAAPPEAVAQLRRALTSELERGTAELARARSGYEAPVIVAFGPGLAYLPVDQALRADPAAAPERAWLLTAAAVAALVEAGGGALRAGSWEGRLALLAAGADPELAALAFDERVAGIDRLRARGVPVAALGAPDDPRPPANPALPDAERVARLGGNPADADELDELARPHQDPEPAVRAARRILQRLRGMGKWGGYHTEFAHLAKGFPGHDRALAAEVGEALLAAGLLTEKPSVGQRHVSLAPGRAPEIHALVDQGVVPPSLRLPEYPGR